MKTTVTKEAYRRAFLGLLVVGVTLAFIAVMRAFLMTVLLAAIFSALLAPFYRRVLRGFRGHRSLASAVSIILVVIVVLAPLGFFAGLVVKQAVQISQNAEPWIREQIAQPDRLDRLFEKLPAHETLRPYKEEILLRVGAAARSAGGFLVDTLSSATKGTFTFLLHLVLMLYSMYFFLINGAAWLSRVGSYLPLSGDERGRITDRFVSVTRAALMSTVVIGVIQGTLAGAAMAVAGVPGAMFWGTLMAVLSMIPGIGTGLVWVPAGIYLLAIDRVAAAMLFMAFCAVIVGSVDNLLRPRIVGKGTRLPELLVLLSTLGGIMLFGPIGFIIGPVIAAVFITVWDIYAASMERTDGSRPSDALRKDMT